MDEGPGSDLISVRRYWATWYGISVGRLRHFCGFRELQVDWVLTVPMPSMANKTVAKNSGMWPTGAIHGRDPISGSGSAVAQAPSPANRLTPVTTHDMVHPSPTSMKAVAMAENGTNSRSVRMIPSGTSGMASPRIHARTEKCHSGGVCVSATCKKKQKKIYLHVRSGTRRAGRDIIPETGPLYVGRRARAVLRNNFEYIGFFSFTRIAIFGFNTQNEMLTS